MSIFTIIAKALALIPSAIEAGKAIANALRPARKINPDDSLLWHTVTFLSPATPASNPRLFCTVCQQRVHRQNELCSEAVRRAQLN